MLLEGSTCVGVKKRAVLLTLKPDLKQMTMHQCACPCTVSRGYNQFGWTHESMWVHGRAFEKSGKPREKAEKAKNGKKK